MSTIPVGATLTHIYFAVRTSPYALGDRYDNWDDAVIAAQAAYDARVADLSAASPNEPGQAIAKIAKRSVYLETRWVMAWGGGSEDFMHERHPDVTVLRTRASFAPKLPVLPTADQVRSLTAKEAVGLAHNMNEE